MWRSSTDGRGAALRARRRAAGFSLLEVLVAFVILSLVGTALFRMFGGAMTNVAAASDYSRALLVAESLLAETAGTQPLVEATQAGTSEDGQLSWKAEVKPYAAPQANADLERASDVMSIRLWKVVAEVTFPSANGKPRTLALSTVRVGVKDAR